MLNQRCNGLRLLHRCSGSLLQFQLRLSGCYSGKNMQSSPPPGLPPLPGFHSHQGHTHRAGRILSFPALIRAHQMDVFTVYSSQPVHKADCPRKKAHKHNRKNLRQHAKSHINDQNRSHHDHRHRLGHHQNRI